MKKEKICGIYCIENLIDEKKYVGSSISIYQRWNCHLCDLKKDRHANIHLQRAWGKYGEENFKFYILIECISDIELIEKLEVFYIKLLKTTNDKFGYNLQNGGKRGSLGIPRPKEERERRSLFTKGRIMSEEAKRKISLSKIGKKRDDALKRKVSESKTGVKVKKYNTDGTPKDPTSKYIGVVKNKIGRFKSFIKDNRENIHLGTFYFEIEAAMAYNEAALEFYGWKAKLNIILQEEIDILWETDGESYSGSGGWNKGISPSEETRKKISETKKREKNKNASRDI